ncbi:MAG: hypothetical protein GC164_02575 [Phycisphaera sp.]|nr:hypothetical protein [Phycisphaera sp.]
MNPHRTIHTVWPRPADVDSAQPVELQHPRLAALAGMWPLWLQSTNLKVFDRSERGATDMAVYGSPTINGARRFGRAMSFNSASLQYADAGPSPVLVPPFTALFWYYPTTTNNDSPLSLFATADSDHYYAARTVSGKLRFYAVNPSTYSADSATSCTVNDWNLGCIVAKSTTDLAVYLNDGVGGQATTPTHNITAAAVAIGCRGNGSNRTWHFTGQIAEVILLARAVSSEERVEFFRNPFEHYRVLTHRAVFTVPSVVTTPSSPPVAFRSRRFDFEVPQWGEWASAPVQGEDVALAQSESAAFPDRRRSGTNGLGVRATLTNGTDGSYFEQVYTQAIPVLHVRFVVGHVAVSGGSATVVRVLDNALSQAWRVTVEPVTGTVVMDVAGGTQLSASFTQGLSWHCVEAALDTDTGTARLWVNGIEADSASASFAGLAARGIHFGVPLKDSAATGTFDLDEFAIDTAYIGPVGVEPSSEFADDPARWGVVYNADDSDSITWADAYRASRGVPYANLIGLNLPTSETLSAAQFADMVAAIKGYLTDNGLWGQCIGVLTGFGVPGYVDFEGTGLLLEAVPDLLHNDSAVRGASTNPLNSCWPMARPTAGNLLGRRLTARLDAPDLATALAQLDCVDAVSQGSIGDGKQSTIFLDPYTTPGGTVDAVIEEMVAWSGSLDRMRTRLPIELSAQSDPGAEVGFDSIAHDGFFWGWSEALPPTGFFASPSGSRVFAGQWSNIGATGPTLRSGSPTDWVGVALASGYASAAGSPRAFSVSVIPSVKRFFEALRLGWTLGEAWFSALPILRDGLFLVGDPLMRVPLPRSGWDVFGPMATLEELDPDTPMLAMRSDELALPLSTGNQPAEGEQAIYVVRRLDDAGRSEAGVTHVRVANSYSVVAAVPCDPVWPTHPLWRVDREDGALKLTVTWERSLESSRVAIVELLARSGEPLATHVVLTVKRAPLQHEIIAGIAHPTLPTQYAWRYTSADGYAKQTPWSESVEPVSVTTTTLKLLEAKP